MTTEDTHLQEDSHIFYLFLDWREYCGRFLLLQKHVVRQMLKMQDICTFGLQQ